MSDRPEPFRGVITPASAEEHPEQQQIAAALMRQFSLKQGDTLNRLVIEDDKITLEYFPAGQSVGMVPKMRSVTAARVPSEKYPS